MKNLELRKRLLTVVLTGAVALSGLAGCGNTTVVATDEPVSETAQVEENEVAAAETAENKEEAAVETESNEPKDYGTLYVAFPTGNIRITIDILAKQLGYFDEEGVKVEPVNLAGPNALTAIDSGSDELDLLTVGFVPDLQALASGYDLAFIAGTAVEGGAVIAKKGNADQFKDASKIINVDAFTNAKLGFVRNEASWVVTRQYLLDNGVDAATIAAIESEGSGNITYYADETETAQAVQKGAIEIGFLPLEYALLYADSYDLEIITAAGDLLPNYICCREVTSHSKLNEKRDAFEAYEKARIRAWEYYKKGETDDTVKADVVKIVSDYSGKESDYVETYLYGGVTKFSCDPNASGIKSYSKAVYNSGALADAGIDFNTYDISQNISDDVYKNALDELVKEQPDNEFYASLEKLYDEYK